MPSRGKRAIRWCGLFACGIALAFSLSGVAGVLARPRASLSGTSWSGMGHSARFLDGDGYFDGEPFSYAESSGMAKGELDGGGAIDFVLMSGDRLFCVTEAALLLRQ